jgi:AcrR family transcriptional regulator
MQTRLAISNVATRLFIERGFDRVTIAEVADAANVSVNTIFNYFKTKEELFFDRAEEVIDIPSRIVREREPGESVVAALHRGYRDAIKSKGFLFGEGQRLAPFFATVEASPALKARERLLTIECEQRLAKTLAEETNVDERDPTAHAVAWLVIGLTTMLVRQHRDRLLRGEPDGAMRRSLVRLADRGFALLRGGVGEYGTRKSGRAGAKR